MLLTIYKGVILVKGIILFISLFFTVHSFAEDVCKAPQKETITLSKLDAKEKQLVYFGGRYSIKLNAPAKVIFSRDMLGYQYSKDKYMTLHADSIMTEANKNQYLIAFGLQSEEKTNQDSIYIRKGLNICNGKITHYKIEGMTETIIATHNKVDNKPNTMVYLFNEVSPFIELIQFTGFSNEAIKTSLSTLEKVKGK